jgi:hypothetical protein
MPFAPVTYQTSIDALGNPLNATNSAAIAAGASTTTIKAAPGRVIAATVTAAGTSTDNITIYDNASAGSGTILAVIAGGGTIGTRFVIDAPALNGITVVNVASGPAVTIGYS